MPECWRCGRAVSRGGVRYVFGTVCARADCRRVRMAFSKCHEIFWFRAALPEPGFQGRPASYTLDGEMNHQQAMSDPGLNRAMQIDATAGVSG